MRHRKAGRKLGINTSQRKALLRNLAISLLAQERIKTTLARAKELRPMVDRLVSLGKKADLSAIRMAASLLNSKEAVSKLFKEIAPRFSSRKGGYTRLVRTGWRTGDGASLCLVELVSAEETKGKKGLASKGGKKTKAKEGKEKA